MIPLNLLIAAVCITTDAKFDAPPCPLSAFRAVAVQWELMDADEWPFRHPEYFPQNLECIQERYRGLLDAPPAIDAERFPSRDFCCEMAAFNRTYLAHLEQLRLVSKADWIREAMTETEELYRAWDLARDAVSGYAPYYRRRALCDLRDLIGPHAYYAGCLPCPVPVWRFQRTD